jgi:predicted lipoprotein with Yx(FWY)xxD motif
VTRVLPYLAAMVALAACGSSGKPSAYVRPVSTPAPAAGKPPKRTQPTGTRITTHKTRFGRIVTDAKGRTLYVFTRDSRGPSRCYGQCAKAWPPLITRGRPGAAKGARGRLLGTTRRRGGTLQVTYRGQPLYYYVGDRHPGEVLCQNVVEYGGTWLVSDPSGKAVQ